MTSLSPQEGQGLSQGHGVTASQLTPVCTLILYVLRPVPVQPPESQLISLSVAPPTFPDSYHAEAAS